MSKTVTAQDKFISITADNILLLKASPENFPSCLCGDCSVNVKRWGIIEETYRTKLPLTRYSCYTSSGSIRRVYASERMYQKNTKVLYENLECIWKQFAENPKSTELLNFALDSLEQ